MKKLFTLALSLLMLVSCFAISASAAGVNVAPNGSYTYEGEVQFMDGKSDDLNELFIDGNAPLAETPFESVSITGTGAIVTVTFNLGACYSDITDINFLSVCDSQTANGGNRGFSGEKTIFTFSTDGVDYTRNKNFEMTGAEIADAPTMYNYCFKFEEAVTAQYVQIMMYSPVYVLSLGEIEIISASGEGSAPVEPESSEEESIDESIDESAVESTDESAVESTDESVDESAAESTDESADASADESTAASTEESKEASKAPTTSSKAPTSSSADNGDDEGGISPLVIVIIVLVVIAAAVVVVVIMKKRK